MSDLKEKKQESKTEKGEAKSSTRIVDLSDVQKDKIQKLTLMEQQAANKLQDIRNQKNDFFELLLDANGWTPEEMGKVSQVQLNEQNQVVLTMLP